MTGPKTTYGYTRKEFAKYKKYAWPLILASISAFLGLICFPLLRSQLLATVMRFAVGLLDWAVYMGAAVFMTIGCFYIVLLVLTLAARKPEMRSL